MISRAEYLYLKSRSEKIGNQLFDCEYKSELYQMWTKYMNLSEDEKVKLKNAWNNYYKQAHDGYYGQMFRKAGRAAEDGKVNQLKEVVREMNEANVPYIKTHSTLDPDELVIKMRRYFELKNKLKELKDALEEYAPVYESKRGELGL